MAVKTCVVSCRDLDGTTHSVVVGAESLYDAVAQGLHALRGHEWIGQIGPGSIITVKVREPEIEHQVRVRDFEAWLERTGTSPREVAQRKRIRERLQK